MPDPGPPPAPTPDPEPEPVTVPAVQTVTDIKSGTDLRVVINAMSLPPTAEFAVRRTGPDGVRWVEPGTGLGHVTEQWASLSLWGDGTGRLVAGLERNDEYRFSVKAKVAGGAESLLSSEIAGTPTRPDRAPAPINFSASTITETDDTKNALLEWDSSGGTTAGFVITYRVYEDETSVLAEECAGIEGETVISAMEIGAATSYKVTGLDENSFYLFQVCAINDASPPDRSSAAAVGVLLSSEMTISMGKKSKYPEGENAGDGFGFAVSSFGFDGTNGIGDTNGHAAIGAPFHSFDVGGAAQVAGAGSVYAYFYDDEWKEDFVKLVAEGGSNARVAGDVFGSSVAVDSTWLLVGAPGQDFDAAGQNELADAGAVYAYKWNGTTWNFVQKIVANSRQAAARFGASLALSSTNAYIGAPNQDNARGAVHRFTRSGDVWSYSSSAAGEADGDTFGTSLAATDTSVIVGAPFHQTDASGLLSLSEAGAAYVYDSLLNLTQKLDGSTAAVPNGRNVADHFGRAVSITNDYAVVGAPGHDYDHMGSNSVAEAGACYFFSRQGGSWTFGQKLVPSSSRRIAGSSLGMAISISSEPMVRCGAPFYTLDNHGDNPLAGAGAIFAFSRASADSPLSNSIVEVLETRQEQDQFGAAIAPKLMKMSAAGAPALGTMRPGKAAISCGTVAGGRGSSLVVLLLLTLPIAFTGVARRRNPVRR